MTACILVRAYKFRQSIYIALVMERWFFFPPFNIKKGSVCMVGLCTYLVLGPVNLTSVIYGSSFVNCINVKNPTHTSGVYGDTKEKLSGHPSPGRAVSRQVITSTQRAFCVDLLCTERLFLLPFSFQPVVGL